MKALRHGLLTVLVLAAQQIYAAQTVNEQVFQLEKSSVIDITGFSGIVNLNGSSEITSNQIKVRIVNKLPQVELRGPSSDKTYPRILAKQVGKNIAIEYDQEFSVEQWANFLTSDQWPTADIEISGAPRGLELSWRNGKITATNWSDKLFIDATDAQIKVSGGEGDLELSSLEGEVSVSDRKGSLKITTHEGSQNIASIQGGLNLENFSGTLKVEATSGDLNLSSYSGKSVIDAHEGPIQFDTHKASLTLSQVKDQLRGSNDSGEVMIETSGPSNINIKSKEGLVSVKAQNSGAFVIASSLEGLVNVPGHFEAYRGPDTIQRSGRLRGEHPGRVVVRSEKGQVRIQ